MPKRLNLIDLRFERLLVVAQSATVNSKTHWLCRCECGVEVVVMGALLTTKQTRSCGCLKRDMDQSATARMGQLRHGHAGHGPRRTREYFTWQSMVQRCTNPNSGNWADYGGRGITICDRWRDSFEMFLADMGPKPRGSSIDRIDNNKGYEPGNCEWTTSKAQNRNKRSVALNSVAVDLIRYMHRRGAKRSDLARAFGVSDGTVGNVVARRTWA